MSIIITINYPSLTLEQIELIPEYISKWQQVALNQEPINREQAKLAINKTYDLLNKIQPNILFFATPYEALKHIYHEADKNWEKIYILI